MGNKGLEAALAAVEMANLTGAVVGQRAVSSQLSAFSKSRKRKRRARPKKRAH
jgi:hypothetical protein